MVDVEIAAMTHINGLWLKLLHCAFNHAHNAAYRQCVAAVFDYTAIAVRFYAQYLRGGSTRLTTLAVVTRAVAAKHKNMNSVSGHAMRRHRAATAEYLIESMGGDNEHRRIHHRSGYAP
jgi:hypothetical protein